MSLSEATAITQLDSHSYTADFSSEWVIGTVPHGGYVTSCFMAVVRKHFDTTLHKQDQPHTITLHLDFLRRTQVGLATFTVKDIKLGRQTSVVHVSLSQDSREEVVGYITNSNINKEVGISASTDWSLHPQPPPLVSFTDLEADKDPFWAERYEWPHIKFRKATTKIRSFFPRKGWSSPACLDMWYCFSDPKAKFTNESLGYVCDTFPQIIEYWALGDLDTYSITFERENSKSEQIEIVKQRNKYGQFWYPTVLLNLDVKKALPEDGVRWLFVRLQAKKIKNGRYDLEVIAMESPEGEIVAISNHVVYAVSAERNTATRRKADGGGGSKL